MSGKVPRRVAICGGGVAAVEALLALHELLPIPPHIDLIAPNREFVYQPVAVAEPFGLARTRLFEIADLAGELGAELHIGVLEQIDPAQRQVVLGSGTRLPYDAAIIAVGARRHAWLAGASSFGGAKDVSPFAEMLGRLEQGEISQVAFTSPPRETWTLPLYELALLTASRLAEQGTTGVELTIITPEPIPLAIFGTTAGRMLRDELCDRGIHLRAGVSAREIVAGRLTLNTGEAIAVEEVVALPRLEGPRIHGLPASADGFIPIDDHCRVAGLEDVYAAGDATSFPIKQGGIATQQADVAAESIAAHFGAAHRPSVFDPLLRGMLLTGVAPLYLRAGAAASGAGDSQFAANPLWSPPTKIAGRYLGPYLAGANTLIGHTSLEDRRASTRSEEEQQAAHHEARELALVFAESDARGGDYRSALEWLEVVERLDGILPPGYLEKRDLWKGRAGG